MSPPGYRRHAEVLWRRVPGGAVVLPPTQDAPIHLNGPAVLVWELFDSGATVGAVRDAVAALCDADPDEISEDVAGMVAYLVGAGTLEVAR